MSKEFFGACYNGKIKQLPKHTKALNHLKQVWQTHNSKNWDYLQAQIERIERYYINKLNSVQLDEFRSIKSAFMATYKDKLGGDDGRC